MALLKQIASGAMPCLNISSSSWALGESSHQKQSAAIGSNQQQSAAISSNQMHQKHQKQSEAIRSHLDGGRPPRAPRASARRRMR